jgi:signal transduction histidine kinase
MKIEISRIPLQWRVFLATSITVTALFAVAGWGLQHYAVTVADESVRTEIRASIQSYEAVWKARTQELSVVTSLMSAMSDVRAAFLTRDPETIRDSVQELWSRVPEQPAVFLVLDGEGRFISSLGTKSELSPAAIPIQQVRSRFPEQIAGYLRANSNLFYIVLTPVYVQTSREPLLLNVLCAGFRIDNHVAEELKMVAPGSDFAFLDRQKIFASTLGKATDGRASERLLQTALSGDAPIQQDQFILSRQQLDDVTGTPIAELRIIHSYATVNSSLANLQRVLEFAWLATIALALLISSVATDQVLQPIKLLDRAAAEVAARNYRYRLPVSGTGELARLAATFNQMCDSIQEAQADLVRQEQIHTIGRLATSLVHDLRNPLAAIYGGAEMLIDDQALPDQARRIASNIYRASNRMQELLRDLLQVSRGETLQQEVCRLREIVEAAAESVEGAKSNVRIRVAIDDAMEVFVNRTRVERVFFNLLSNAVEAMPDGGDVFIYANREKQDLKVFVEDTGPGVPIQVRADLFRPFVTAGKRSGMGLGLTLARKTMLDLGGDLQFIERTESGACFCLRFPADMSAQQTSPGKHVPAVQA